jgi:hypothetical protein
MQGRAYILALLNSRAIVRWLNNSEVDLRETDFENGRWKNLYEDFQILQAQGKHHVSPHPQNSYV